MPRRRLSSVLLLAALTLLLSACGRNMYEQPKYEVFEANPYFANGATVRPLVEGTVSRQRGGIDPAVVSGQAGEFPLPVTMEVLEHGQERYNIYCSPCHNFTGDGRGVIVQRGFPQPRSFTDPAVASQPNAWFYNAMSNGFGRMFPYASRVPVEDRWAIVAYIRALQLSQNAQPGDVPTGLRPAGGADGDSHDQIQGAIR